MKSKMFFSVVFLLIFLLMGCQRKEFARQIVVENSGYIQEGSIFWVTLNLIDIGNGIQEFGHCWGVKNPPKIDQERTINGPAVRTGEHTFPVEGIPLRTQYFIRAYVVSQDQVYYSPAFTVFRLE